MVLWLIKPLASVGDIGRHGQVIGQLLPAVLVGGHHIMDEGEFRADLAILGSRETVSRMPPQPAPCCCRQAGERRPGPERPVPEPVSPVSAGADPDGMEFAQADQADLGPERLVPRLVWQRQACYR